MFCEISQDDVKNFSWGKDINQIVFHIWEVRIKEYRMCNLCYDKQEIAIYLQSNCGPMSYMRRTWHGSHCHATKKLITLILLAVLDSLRRLESLWLEVIINLILSNDEWKLFNNTHPNRKKVILTIGWIYMEWYINLNSKFNM